MKRRVTRRKDREKKRKNTEDRSEKIEKEE
jgi:hypothetical protein